MTSYGLPAIKTSTLFSRLQCIPGGVRNVMNAVVPVVGFTALVGVTRNFDTVDHMMAIVLQMLYKHVPTLFRFLSLL